MSQPEQLTDKQLVISYKAAQTILNYLASRPFQEVHQLAPLLINLPVVPESNVTPVAVKSETE